MEVYCGLCGENSHQLFCPFCATLFDCQIGRNWLSQHRTETASFASVLLAPPGATKAPQCHSGNSLLAFVQNPVSRLVKSPGSRLQGLPATVRRQASGGADGREAASQPPEGDSDIDVTLAVLAKRIRSLSHQSPSGLPNAARANLAKSACESRR